MRKGEREEWKASARFHFAASPLLCRWRPDTQEAGLPPSLPRPRPRPLCPVLLLLLWRREGGRKGGRKGAGVAAGVAGIEHSVQGINRKI